MKNKRTLLVALLCSSVVQPASALQWKPAPPLPPLPASSLKWEGDKQNLLGTSSPSRLDWQVDRDEKDNQKLVALAWKIVEPSEIIDPEVAREADLKRQEAYQQLFKSPSDPFRPWNYTPYLAGYQPSAYINQWGEGWIGAFGSTADNLRDGTVDATINMRLGLGDPDKFVAVQAGWDIVSTRNLNANGSFDLRIARVLHESRNWQITAGGGLLEIGRYGNESGQVDTNGYGVLSFATPLRHHSSDFSQLLQFSFGIGGNRFAPVPDGQFLPADTMGYFLAAGVQVTPNIGFSVGRSGRGANAVLSLLPNTDLPLYFEASAVDLFDESAGGTVGLFSVRFGGRNLYRPKNPSTFTSESPRASQQTVTQPGTGPKKKE